MSDILALGAGSLFLMAGGGLYLFRACAVRELMRGLLHSAPTWQANLYEALYQLPGYIFFSRVGGGLVFLGGALGLFLASSLIVSR
jgi:hypothetical protein